MYSALYKHEEDCGLAYGRPDKGAGSNVKAFPGACVGIGAKRSE